MVASKEGPTGAIVIDDRYAPLIVSSFIGDVDLSVGVWYEKAVQRIIQQQTLDGRRVVNVHDASRSTRTSPEMRKFWADMSARNAATIEARTLANVVVVTNPLIRGVLTAVSWMNPRVASMKIFSTLDEAVSEATAMLDEAGTPVVLPPQGYQPPDTSLRMSLTL